MAIEGGEVLPDIIIRPRFGGFLHMGRAFHAEHGIGIKIGKGRFEHHIDQFSGSGFAGSDDGSQHMAHVSRGKGIDFDAADGWQHIAVDQIAIGFKRPGAQFAGA